MYFVNFVERLGTSCGVNLHVSRYMFLVIVRNWEDNTKDKDNFLFMN